MIYLHDVPHPKALPVIQPARMVKGVIPTDLTNGAIPKDALLFSALTPFAVHHACDLWSNRKNYRVREFEQRCAQLDKLQAEALHALGLPGSLQAVDRTSEIPPSLLKKIEELQNDGGLEMLEKLSDEVQLLAFSNENVIDEVRTLTYMLTISNVYFTRQLTSSTKSKMRMKKFVHSNRNSLYHLHPLPTLHFYKKLGSYNKPLRLLHALMELFKKKFLHQNMIWNYFLQMLITSRRYYLKVSLLTQSMMKIHVNFVVL